MSLLLNYHDAVLYRSDLALLESPTEWLNDACIHFGMTRLQHSQCQPHPATFLDPSVISFVMHTDDDEEGEDKNSILPFPDNTIIVIPINDGQVSETWQRGSHWSLVTMVADRRDDDFNIVHYDWLHWDSVHGSSHALVAQLVTHKLQSIWNLPRQSNRECATPQQTNGYDCGIHVLAAAEILVPILPNASVADAEDALRDTIHGPHFCNDMRKRLSLDIQRLAAIYAASSS